MKLLVILCVVALGSAAPQAQSSSPQDIQLLRIDSDNDGLGTYRYSYEQSDGHKKEEAGELKNAGTDDEAISMKGSYSWIGPDGVTYTVTYIADENGFQPTIQQGPGGAVPSAVVASLVG